MARKKKVKIVKEFVNTQFKEVETSKSNSGSIVPEEFEEDKLENNGDFSGNGFSNTGRRTAPVLQAENTSQSLESVAETAPVRKTDTNDNPGNQVYSADYTAKYDSAKYETMSEEPVVRPTVRSSGVLNDVRNVGEPRRVQPTWQGQTAPDQARGDWNPNLPDERVYHPKDDDIKERTKQIDKRRRMF
ncbi:MAG: hypothetical protein ABH840_03010 [Nanoarchaeota archaeon]